MKVSSGTHVSRWLFLLGVLFVWELVTGGVMVDFQPVDPFFISSPTRIAVDLVALAQSGRILRDISVTLVEALLGLFLGLSTGMLIGLLFASSRRLSDLFDPFMAALNSLPRAALAPVLIFWFGTGLWSKVVLAWSLSFFIVYYNTYLGARSIDPDMVNAIRVMGASRADLQRIVVIPAVLSWVFAALRTSVAYALIGAVVGEFVGATAGIGYQLVYAEGLLMTDRMYSLLVILGVVGISLIKIAEWAEERLLHWRPPVRF
jgi:NitT/TauT family transport system permease protein